jgi:hypothetical protein
MSTAHPRRGKWNLGVLLALAAFSRTPARAEPAAITPHENIVLYDSRERHDLSAFYTWLAKFGRDADPEHVFTLVDQIDGAPAIRISGQFYGGIVTKERYTNYRVVAEFRWGHVTWGDRKNKARDSGILLHVQGEDGNNNKSFRGPWARSVEYQILEGGTGDIWLVNGYDRDRSEAIAPRLTIATTQRPNGLRVWDPAGKPGEFTIGRIAWGKIDPDWNPALGFRGRDEVEKPHGQWNRIEAICEGGNLTYYLNGVKINEGTNGSFTEGRLLFQSEGAEIFFRHIELQPLKKQTR